MLGVLEVVKRVLRTGRCGRSLRRRFRAICRAWLIMKHGSVGRKECSMLECGANLHRLSAVDKGLTRRIRLYKSILNKDYPPALCSIRIGILTWEPE